MQTGQTISLVTIAQRDFRAVALSSVRVVLLSANARIFLGWDLIPVQCSWLYI